MACGNQPGVYFPDQVIENGEFKISCFYNHLATEAHGPKIYTETLLDLREDGTGSNYTKLYLTEDCSGSPELEAILEISEYENHKLRDYSVFKMTQFDGYSTMSFWIAYKQVGGHLYLNLEDGPNLTEDVRVSEDFWANPSQNGTLIVNIDSNGKEQYD